MSGEKAVTRQHLQDSLEAVLQALDAAGERLAAVEGETPFLRTLAEAHELGAELLRRSKVHDDTADLAEAVAEYVAAVEAHEAYLERNYEVRDAAECDEAVERIGKWWDAMKAALARVRGVS